MKNHFLLFMIICAGSGVLTAQQMSRTDLYGNPVTESRKESNRNKPAAYEPGEVIVKFKEGTLRSEFIRSASPGLALPDRAFDKGLEQRMAARGGLYPKSSEERYS